MGPFRYPWGAQKGPFGLKQTLTRRTASERPKGPYLVPTAANWSEWVGIMVTTHFGLILGLFWAPKKDPFWPRKDPFWPQKDPFWPVKDPNRAKIQNCYKPIV